MNQKTMEAIIASPPERDDLVVQLFLKEGGQWGEIFKEAGHWWLELYPAADREAWRLDLVEVQSLIELAFKELRHRLGDS